MAGDVRDWSLPTGALRYVGSFSISGSGPGGMSVSVRAFERSIIVFYSPVGQGSGSLQFCIRSGPAPVVFTRCSNIYTDGAPLLGGQSTAFMGYVNPSLTSQWEVQTDSSDSGASGTAYVFVGTDLPLPALVDPSAPLPVYLPSSQLPLSVQEYGQSLYTYVATWSLSLATANQVIAELRVGANDARVLYAGIWPEVLPAAAAQTLIIFRRYSNAGSGGTALSISPFDGNHSSPAATAWSGSSGLSGTFTLKAQPLGLAAAASGTAFTPCEWPGSDGPNLPPLTLNYGSSSAFTIQNTNAVAGATVRGMIIWQESV